MNYLVTGGAGFIGLNFILKLFNKGHELVIIDKLSYASNQEIVSLISNNRGCYFYKADLFDSSAIDEIFAKHKPNRVIHFAAESHVDNSISNPIDFINSNIIGTFNLLQSSLSMINKGLVQKNDFIFHHISTDEVYGDLGLTDDPFTEKSNYRPSSPYAASKASSDHLVRSWGRTYDLPVNISNCSNNYGPFQHIEKLIPKAINCLINHKRFPLYGSGNQIRDWIFVEDHVDAILAVLSSNVSNETFNIGANNERTNRDVLENLCLIFNDICSKYGLKVFESADFIEEVPDRPGHDFRYAISNTKIESNLKWTPKISFEEGLLKTIIWYLDRYKTRG